MTSRLRQHAKAFAGGFCIPPALVISAATLTVGGPGSGDLIDKIQDWSEVGCFDDGLTRSQVAGALTFIPCALFAAVAIGYVNKTENPSFSDFGQKLPSISFLQQGKSNAQTGAQKVAEAASAAGIIVPKLQGGPQ